jgi:hypothetical protein
MFSDFVEEHTPAAVVAVVFMYFVAIGLGPPNPGYVAQDDGTWFKKYQWTPGWTSPDLPHLTASLDKDYWIIDPGYKFINPDGDFIDFFDRYDVLNRNSRLKVYWSPGVAFPGIEQITASFREGQWLIAPGYQIVGAFDPSSPDNRVVWTPGSNYPDCPKIVAGGNEGHWVPVSGYEFISAGSLDVVESDGSVLADIVINSLIEGALNSLSKPSPDDGIATGTFKGGVGIVGDIAGEQANQGIDELFDPQSRKIHRCGA